MAKAGWMVCAALAGCAGSSDVDPSELHTGIYRLQVSTHVDTCDPARTSGDRGDVAVFVSDLGIAGVDSVELQGVTDVQRYELSAEAGYASTAGIGLLPGSLCGGDSSFLTHRQLVTATTDGFVVNEATSWTVTTPCADGSTGTIPTASCHSDQDQHYHLVSTCDAPCQLFSTDAGAYTCKCQ